MITCKDPDVVLYNVQQPHPMNATLMTTYCWIPPQITNSVCLTQMNTSVPGVHTCIATSFLNGCKVIKTYTVLQDIIPPDITNDDAEFILECAETPTTKICVSLAGNTTALTYTWIGVPSNATVSGLTGSCITTNTTGAYAILVTNTVNGCSNHAHYTVKPGTIHAAFQPSPSSGYAPLSVTFTNQSATSLGNTVMISSWYYGNGQTLLQTQQPITSTTYTSAGIYTVVLLIKKGHCVDTAIRVIKVENPSHLEVPNIFTPNGDGVNDVFRLIAAQLKEIYIIIFDRWGNRVYETESTTGNISWDGKNLQGKNCADGVYFYILKATGWDDVYYERKGNITLIR
jgi:gliding motility-associated-like protein